MAAPGPLTEVVNVRVACIRKLGDDNLREWMARPGHVYIGRRGTVFVPTDTTEGGKMRWPLQDSPWANPFRVDAPGKKNDGDRDDVIRKYREHIAAKVAAGIVDLADLRGKKLGCWCKPLNCHGDVLLDMLNEG
jgi:Domain of unknown function (DUF4326)